MRAHGIHPNGGPATPQPLPRSRQTKTPRLEGPTYGSSSNANRDKGKGKKTAADKQAQFNEEMNVDDEELELGDVKEEDGDGMGNGGHLLTSEEGERLVVKVEKDDEGVALSNPSTSNVTDGMGGQAEDRTGGERFREESHDGYGARQIENSDAVSPRTVHSALPSVSLASSYGASPYGGYQSFGSAAQSQWSTPTHHASPMQQGTRHTPPSPSRAFAGGYDFNDYTPRQGTPTHTDIPQGGGGAGRDGYGQMDGADERSGDRSGSVVVTD